REQKKQKSKARRARREAEARGEEVERKEPRSIDKMREPDETIVPPDDSEVEDDEAMDEFEKYFSGDQVPKILLTTQKKPSSKMFDLLKELIHVIPNTFYYPRKEFTFKKICKEAGDRGFTDIILFHEKAKQVQGLYICHLPHGPTSYWRLTRLKLGQEMKGSATCNASHHPELILNNFVTRLGRRVGRQLLALFPQADRLTRGPRGRTRGQSRYAASLGLGSLPRCRIECRFKRQWPASLGSCHGVATTAVVTS
ncbi:unnamed protein product, partial [Prorocentrum cordatum]